VLQRPQRSVKKKKKSGKGFFVFFFVPSPVSSGGTLGEGDGGVDESQSVGHASADIVEVGADEEMVVAGFQSGISNKLEFEGVLRSVVNNVVVTQTSQLEHFVGRDGRQATTAKAENIWNADTEGRFFFLRLVIRSKKDPNEARDVIGTECLEVSLVGWN
jgi:hypothetical protein